MGRGSVNPARFSYSFGGGRLRLPQAPCRQPEQHIRRLARPREILIHERVRSPHMQHTWAFTGSLCLSAHSGGGGGSCPLLCAASFREARSLSSSSASSLIRPSCRGKGRHLLHGQDRAGPPGLDGACRQRDSAPYAKPVGLHFFHAVASQERVVEAVGVAPYVDARHLAAVRPPEVVA